jgi:hypothetical protein
MVFLKKVQIERESKDNGASETLPAIFEPLPGHSDAEVLDSLMKAGAENVQHLASGFISATAGRDTLKMLESIAAVHLKREKRMIG